MSSRLDLGPADLDRLEDALEDLELRSELDGDPDLDVDDPVALRLVEYRALLLLSREAMPLEEVPAGILDGVLAQARQAAAGGAAAATPAPSFWARWRLGLWVPTLAFAGSAALLLLVLVPKQADEAATASATDVSAGKEEERPAGPSAAAKAEQADGRLAMADQPAPEPEQDLELDPSEDALRGAGMAIGERGPEPAAVVPPTDPATGPPTEETPSLDEARQKKADRKTSTGSSGAGGASSPATTKPSPAPKAPGLPGAAGKGKPSAKPDPIPQQEEKKQANKDDDGSADPWTEISRADGDRRGGGGCGLAKMRYEKLRKVDDPRVRARALAGLGLCEAAADDMSTAKKLFAQAKAADPGVSGFIDAELAKLDAPDPSPISAD